MYISIGVSTITKERKTRKSNARAQGIQLRVHHPEKGCSNTGSSGNLLSDSNKNFTLKERGEKDPNRP